MPDSQSQSSNNKKLEPISWLVTELIPPNKAVVLINGTYKAFSSEQPGKPVIKEDGKL